MAAGALALMEGVEQVDELVVAPARHGEDEFERLAAGQSDRLQRLQIVQAEQPAVGHQDQAAHGREARQHLVSVGSSVLVSAVLPSNTSW